MFTQFGDRVLAFDVRAAEAYGGVVAGREPSGDRLGLAVSFRNPLVRGCADIDDERVVAHLDGLSSLRDYVSAMSELI